ncbi:MAG: AAA family ATPase [Planctomycetaceae bacterium]|nr:AAA family ATPase [Planctomycetaceae bacterium]
MQPGQMALVPPRSDQDESVRRNLAGLIGQSQYDHWFRGKAEIRVDNEDVVVRAGNPFLLKWLQKRFRDPLAEAGRVVIGAAAKLRFEAGVIAEPARDQPLPVAAVVGPTPVAGSATSLIAWQPAVDVPAVEVMLSPRLSPSASSLGDRLASNAEEIAALVVTAPVEPVAPLRAAGRRFADLADFVVSPGNELALTAVRQMCSRPDGAGGPLFLCGGVGTGKTHLLEGLHKQLRRTRRDMHAVYLSSEQFTNYFTQALREHTLPAFRQKFRTVDVLLVDDVDFFEGKRAVQEEFLHTFKQLASFGRLIVVTAERHPRLLTKTSDELKTRFLSGLVCRLENPDRETRLRIVTRKARQQAIDISGEALRYVAERFSGGVRELEGALNILVTWQQMTSRSVGVGTARKVLADLERDCLRVVRLGDIERVVCTLFGLEAEELRSARRTRSISEPRMLAMYLARRHTRSAYSEIGRHFGGRNHATVIAAERKVALALEQGQTLRVAARAWALRDVLETLEQQLLAG